MKKLLLLMCLLASSVYAKIISIQATGIYEMASSDSKEEAMNVAVGLAKINAIEKIGTAVQSSFTYTQSSDGKLISKQDARVYSAALMRAKVISTYFNNNVCTAIIEARIDNSKIDEYLKETPETKNALNKLEEKNKEIQTKLEELNDKIKNLSSQGFARNTDGTLFEAVKLRNIELRRIDVIREDLKKIVSISSKDLSGQLKTQRLNFVNGKLAVDAFFSHVKNRVQIKPMMVKMTLSSNNPNLSQLRVDFQWRMPWGEKYEEALSGFAYTKYHTTHKNEYLRLLSGEHPLRGYIEKHDIYIAVSAFGATKKFPISYIETSSHRPGYTVRKGTRKSRSVFFGDLTSAEVESGVNVEYEIIVEPRSAII